MNFSFLFYMNNLFIIWIMYLQIKLIDFFFNKSQINGTMKNVFRCKLPKGKERNTELKIRGVTQNILRDNYGT